MTTSTVTRRVVAIGLLLTASGLSIVGSARGGSADTSTEHLYIDVHDLGPGQVTAAGVAAAHEKDLAVESRHGTRFLEYWVDEARGRVYCLSLAPSPDAVVETHADAHGLIPDEVHAVVEGERGAARGSGHVFLDVHRLGPGAVTAADVAAAHARDLALQARYGVSFMGYWVDEKEGIVWCLSESPDADAIARVHGEAHGLLPDETEEVVRGE